MGMPHEGLLFEETFEKHWEREISFQPYNKQTTPKIRLDSGEIVYGCQIWWKSIGEPEGKSDTKTQETKQTV